jgi:hypothetical protein
MWQSILVLISTIQYSGETVSKGIILLFLCFFSGCGLLIFSQSCEQSLGNQFGLNASVDEIDEVASSLVSEVSSGTCIIAFQQCSMHCPFFFFYASCIVWFCRFLQVITRPIWLAVCTMIRPKDFCQEENFFR